MSPSILIRKAQIEDAERIVEIEREIAKQPGILCSAPDELSMESVIKTISSFLQGAPGIYLVAEYDGASVGHAFLQPHHLRSLRHVAELTIAIHPAWQRRGIGTLLLQSLINWAIESTVIEKIQLNVRASNLKAISLYQKIGFQEEGRLRNRLKLSNCYLDDIVMGMDVRELQFFKT